MSNHIKDVGMKEALFAVVKMNLLRESLVRSPQAASTFSIIFGLDHLMGPEPLKKLWPNRLKMMRFIHQDLLQMDYNTSATRMLFSRLLPIFH